MTCAGAQFGKMQVSSQLRCSCIDCKYSRASRTLAYAGQCIADLPAWQLRSHPNPTHRNRQSYYSSNKSYSKARFAERQNERKIRHHLCAYKQLLFFPPNPLETDSPPLQNAHGCWLESNTEHQTMLPMFTSFHAAGSSFSAASLSTPRMRMSELALGRRVMSAAKHWLATT